MNLWPDKDDPIEVGVALGLFWGGTLVMGSFVVWSLVAGALELVRWLL